MTESHTVLAVGPRTELRELTAADEHEFLALVADSRVHHHPWVSPPDTPAAYASYLGRVGPRYRTFALCRSHDHVLAGIFNLNEIVMGVLRSAYLGYYSFLPSARCGYMREGIQMVVHFAFESIDLHRIEANIRPTNVASLRLVHHCGFEREGYSPNYLFLDGAWQDHERWAIRREIWSPRDDTKLVALAQAQLEELGVG